MMIFQHDDPHNHMGPAFETVYLLLILGPILMALILFLGWKVLKYIDNRNAAKSGEGNSSRAGSFEKED